MLPRVCREIDIMCYVGAALYLLMLDNRNYFLYDNSSAMDVRILEDAITWFIKTV